MSCLSLRVVSRVASIIFSFGVVVGVCNSIVSVPVHFYRIYSVIRQSFFSSKTIRKNLDLFRKGESRTIAKFHRTDLDICSHSRERKTSCYSRINTVYAYMRKGL